MPKRNCCDAKAMKILLCIVLCALASIAGFFIALLLPWRMLTGEECPLNIVMWSTTIGAPVVGVMTSYLLAKYVLHSQPSIFLLVIAIPLLAGLVFANHWFLVPRLENILLPWGLSMVIVILFCEWLLLRKGIGVKSEQSTNCS